MKYQPAELYEKYCQKLTVIFTNGNNSNKIEQLHSGIAQFGFKYMIIL